MKRRLLYAGGLWFAWTCGHAVGFDRACQRAARLTTMRERGSRDESVFDVSR